jgi:cysteine desulfurase
VSAPDEIYLDWNATSPPHPDVVAAMAEAQVAAWGNPSSVHRTGRRASVFVEQARESVAGLLGFRAAAVVFTSGATEANNLALHAAPALITSHLEHPSVTEVGHRLARRGVFVEWLPVQRSGMVDVQAVEGALRRAPPGTMVALTAACHETGVVQPIREVAELTRRHRAHLHVDAVQVLGKLHPGDWSSCADSIAVNVHKIRGPKGIGALAWRSRWSPTPLLVGGGQERGLRPGTLDAALAAGLLVAVERAKALPGAYAGIGPLRDQMDRALCAVGEINGGGSPRLPHVTNLSFDGWSGEELVAALDIVGVRVSSGSACNAGTTTPPKAVEAMLGRERARSAVRISLGETTGAEDVATATERILSVLERRPGRS